MGYLEREAAKDMFRQLLAEAEKSAQDGEPLLEIDMVVLWVKEEMERLNDRG